MWSLCFSSPYPTTNLGYLGPFIKTVSSMIIFSSELFKIKKGQEIISINRKDTSNVVFPFQGKCYYWTLLLKVERFLDYIWILMENICPIFLVTFREGISVITRQPLNTKLVSCSISVGHCSSNGGNKIPFRVDY